MRFRLTDIALALICLSILLTPVFSSFELVALFQGTVKDQTTALTPIAIKALKDVLMMLAGFICVLDVFRRRRLSLITLLSAPFFFYTCILFFKTYYVNAPIALSGLRWLLPILISVFLIDVVEEYWLVRIAKVLFWLFWLHLFFQILEFFFVQSLFGVNSLGFAARSPGIFLVANSGAFFTFLVLFLNYFYGRRAKLFILACGLSVFLTASGTAIVLYFLFCLMALIPVRYIKLAVLSVPLMVLSLLPFLGTLTNRGDDYVSTSYGTRLQILHDFLQNSSWIPDAFGLGTNTGVLMANEFGYSGAMIVDSTINSVIANLGWIGLILFIFLVVGWLAAAIVLSDLELYLFSMIFGIFGTTTIIFEIFPANIVFAVLSAYYIRQRLSFRPRSLIRAS